MRLLKRMLLFVAVVFIVLVLAGYWLAARSFPQIDGTLHVAGLKSKVEIVRDPMGVPHIYAENADDLFFANGYVHAQDRLWQMEYNRRIGHGTLSDMFGAATIKQDRFLRTIGLARAARADLAQLSADDLRPLDSYARGVNAFIETHRDNLPIEFTILNIKPAPWEPIDTLVWAKVMAYDLSGRYEVDLFRQRLSDDQKIGAAKVKELLPPYPATGPFIVSPERNEYGAEIQNPKFEIVNLSIGTPDLTEIAQMDTSLGLRPPDVGSNDWVIDGKISTTGKPILASDQHLGIRMPSIWYEIGLHCVQQNDASAANANPVVL